MTNSEPGLEIAWTNLFYPREFKKQLFVTVSASIMNCLGWKSPLRWSPTTSLFQDHVSKPRDKLRGKVSAEWGVCTSVCGIVIGEQTKTVFILQKAKVPHGSVCLLETCLDYSAWECCPCPCCRAQPGWAGPGLSATAESSLWRLLPCSTDTLQSQPLSRLRQCINVQSSGSWLVHLCFSTLPFLVKSKTKAVGPWKDFSAFCLLVLPLPNRVLQVKQDTADST